MIETLINKIKLEINFLQSINIPYNDGCFPILSNTLARVHGSMSKHTIIFLDTHPYSSFFSKANVKMVTSKGFILSNLFNSISLKQLILEGGNQKKIIFFDENMMSECDKTNASFIYSGIYPFFSYRKFQNKTSLLKIYLENIKSLLKHSKLHSFRVNDSFYIFSLKKIFGKKIGNPLSVLVTHINFVIQQLNDSDIVFLVQDMYLNSIGLHYDEIVKFFTTKNNDKTISTVDVVYLSSLIRLGFSPEAGTRFSNTTIFLFISEKTIEIDHNILYKIMILNPKRIVIYIEGSSLNVINKMYSTRNSFIDNVTQRAENIKHSILN